MTRPLYDLTTLFRHLDPNAPVARHAGETVNGARLYRDVAARAEALNRQATRDWALFHHHGYPALVSLLALWRTGKRAWIAGDNRSATAAALAMHCDAFIGDWPGRDPLPEQPTADDTPFDPSFHPWPDQSDANIEVVIFTSGSSGEPKAIPKRYRQLLNELSTLESAFGDELGDAQFAGTVSHQHIYGLLFRLLWPLAAGRTLHSEAFQDAAGVLRLAARAPVAWVASPAHLKRLRDDLPWNASNPMRAIFCSGGPLPAHNAVTLAQRAGLRATEVYGSSETGGIAWRRQPDHDDAWTLLPGLALEERGETVCLLSPHLDRPSVTLDDQVTQLDTHRFQLHGRRDRLVKVEENRISLAAVEQALIDHPAVNEARVLQPAGEQRLGAVLVLSATGRQELADQGRASFTQGLRRALANTLEPLAIPRRWRLVARLPETGQGKVPDNALQALFRHSQALLPEVRDSVRDPGAITLTFNVDTDLPWFHGHFAEQGVLPGVVQIDWAEGFGRRYFPLPAGPHHLEAIKFNNLILPGQSLSLKLEWKPVTSKLVFAFHSSRGAHSSGRLAFKEPA